MSTTLTCYLIDDDRDEFEIFSVALAHVHPTAVCRYAAGATKAIEELTSDHSVLPDLLFIDMNMPKINGVQCLEAIRKIERLQHVPVYMYSTSSNPLLEEQCKQLGASAYIVKSDSIAETEAILGTLILKQ